MDRGVGAMFAKTENLQHSVDLFPKSEIVNY
jgi:hypothetical protein